RRERMIGRSYASRSSAFIARPSKSLLLLAALCLLTLPQSYKGGASLPHPHALFQFWFLGRHDTAAPHHHRDGDDHGATATEPPSPAGAEAAARAARADTPTVTQMTPSYESSDGIGGDLVTWLALAFQATAGLYIVRRLHRGLTPSPDIPPPRIALVST